ncbi:MAG: 50S ribosomal protein L19e [Sulfolobaceae archaeon]
MSDLKLQKRLAAQVAGVGIKRVKIPPEFAEEVEGELTREDIRKLIEEGKIIIEQKKGNSTSRIKIKRLKKRKKSEGKGHGSRKGSKNARADLHSQWVNRIRKIRRYLKYLRDSGKIEPKIYRKLYRRAKGGAFKSLADVKLELLQMGIKVE